MNLLNIFRKPYLSLILAMLVLFTSCNQNNLLDKTEIETQTLDEYIDNHIELTSKMLKLKDLVDYEVIDELTSLQSKLIETSDLKFTLQNQDIVFSNQLYELQLNLIKNTEILYNNPKYNSLTQQELLNLISNKIINIFENNQVSNLNRDPCLIAFNEANNDCLVQFAASAATVGVIGLFTSFGAGSLIGGYIALVRFGECNERAQEELADCRANQNR